MWLLIIVLYRYVSLLFCVIIKRFVDGLGGCVVLVCVCRVGGVPGLYGSSVSLLFLLVLD